MIIHDSIIQNTDEWQMLRLAKFTASDAQAIGNDGAGLTTLVFKKVAEKLTGKKEESYSNADMDRGTEFEPMARASYELERGIVVKQVGFVEQSEFIGCSPDGLINDDGLLEIKCPSDINYVRYLYDGKITSQYIWQINMQMLVCERQWVDFVVFNNNFPNPIMIERLEADEEKQEKLRIGLESAVKQLQAILAKTKV